MGLEFQNSDLNFRDMDRRSESSRQAGRRTSVGYPMHHSQRANDQSGQSCQQRSHAGTLSPESPHLTMQRQFSRSERSDSDSSSLGRPGEHEIAHSPYPIPANSFIQSAIQFCKWTRSCATYCLTRSRCQAVFADDRTATTFRRGWPGSYATTPVHPLHHG
jgi:hypothetical protein